MIAHSLSGLSVQCFGSDRLLKQLGPTGKQRNIQRNKSIESVGTALFRWYQKGARSSLNFLGSRERRSLSLALFRLLDSIPTLAKPPALGLERAHLVPFREMSLCLHMFFVLTDFARRRQFRPIAKCNGGHYNRIK